MNARFSAVQIGILVILFVCVCCELTGLTFAALALANGLPELAAVASSPTPTRTFRAAATQSPTATPAPTYTRVMATTPGANSPPLALPQRTPTKAPNPYQVVVPTPTAPPLTYPVAFTSTFTVVTYTVTGKTVNDLSKSLEANAIADPHEPGSRYYALTRWQLQSDWTVQSTARGCMVEGGNVAAVITMTLPALAMTTGVSDNVLQRFNTFLDKTVLHEKGHVELTLQGARDYQRALGNHAPTSDCEGLKAQLKNLFRRSFDAIDAANTTYDVKTQHGLTQGAVFP